MADIQSKADAPARDTAGTRLAAKRAAKAAQKAAKKGTTNPAEEVAKSVLEVNAWIDDHAPKLWIGLVAAVVIAIAAFGYSTFQEKRDHEAGALLLNAVTTSEGLIVAPEETPPEDPILPTFGSIKERDEKALKQFQEASKQFPNSLAGTYARLGEANEQLSLGNFPEAAATFDKVAKDEAKNSFIKFRALEGAGYALESQQKYAEARSRFEALSQLQNGAYRTIGDYHRARMLVAEGKRDEARKVLEALNKAAADNPEDQGESGDRFESTTAAVQTLLTELGGQAAEKPSGSSGISQQVLDSLRKQLGAQKK